LRFAVETPPGSSNPANTSIVPLESANPLLDVEDLVVSFAAGERRVAAVNGVSFQVHPGESLGIVGESGSGKSVTVMAVMGLLRGGRVGGTARFGGRDLLALGPRELRKVRGKEIGIVFQDPMSSLNPIQSVGRQIGEVVEAHLGLSRKASRARAIELLELVGIGQARSRVDDLPHEFSGGMRQRVMIAMAVSCDPQLLIADEPTTALDVTTQAQVLELLARLRTDLRMALMFITHDFGVVEEVADRVNVMYAGTLVESGRASRVVREPWHPYTEALLASVPLLEASPARRLGFIRGMPPDPTALPPGCPFAPRCDYALPECTQPVELPLRSVGSESMLCWLEPRARDRQRPLRATSVGAPPDERPAAEAGAAVTPLLTIEGLSVEYDRRWSFGLGRSRSGTRAVDDVTLHIAPGETLGLVGESGSGKSTTGRAILHLAPVTEGRITFTGEDVTHGGRDELRKLARDVKIVFQDSVATLDPRMTVAEIVEEPMRIHDYGDRDARLARVLEVLASVGLGQAFLFRYPHELSGGQRQRVGIARAVVLSPKLIICDEPVSALDVSIQAQVINLFADLKEDLGLTYLFISHDLRVVRQTADRVAVMYMGRILELRKVDRLFSAPAHPYTQLLLASVPDSAVDPFPDGGRSGADSESPDPGTACVFAPRCPLAQARCFTERPELETLPDGGEVACHFWQDATDDWQRRMTP
jgi:peptide/nickel transport system ATP-binding protein